MTLRTVWQASLVAIIAGVVVGFVFGVINEDPRFVEAFVGSSLAAAFFAVSGVVVAVTAVADLKSTLLISYAVKASVLATAGMLLAFIDFDRTVFAISMVTAAVAYLAMTVVIEFRNREKEA